MIHLLAYLIVGMSIMGLMNVCFGDEPKWFIAIAIILAWPFLLVLGLVSFLLTVIGRLSTTEEGTVGDTTQEEPGEE